MITNKGYFKNARDVYTTVKTAIAKTIEKAEQSIDDTIANSMNMAIQTNQFSTDVKIHGLELGLTLPVIKHYLEETATNIRDFGYEVAMNFDIDITDDDYETTTDWTCYLRIGWNLSNQSN